MAIAVNATGRGNGNSKVSGTTIVQALAATVVVGSYLLVDVVFDNIATADGDTTNVTVTDSQGNTYVRLAERQETNGGAAADGVGAAVFMALITTQLTITTDSVTATFSVAVTAKTIALYEATVAAGNVLQLAAGGKTVASTDAAQLPAMTLTPTPGSKEYLWWALHGMEGTAADTYTQDVDYTNKNFPATSGGVATTNVTSRGGRRIFTGTTDTYGATNSDLTRDSANIYLALEEVTPAAGTRLIPAQRSFYPARHDAAVW